MNWPIGAFRRCFCEIAEKGMAEADWVNRVLWLPNAAEYNPPENPNVVRAWAKSLEEIPECSLKVRGIRETLSFLKALKVDKPEAFVEAFVEALPKDLREVLEEALPKDFPKQEQEQEQEQKEERGPVASSHTQVEGRKSKAAGCSKATTFVPPTVDEVRAYAESRGFPNFNAQKFIDYYREADWHDSKGQRVSNWKQKFISVWEKNAHNDAGPVPAESLTHECSPEEADRLMKLVRRR